MTIRITSAPLLSWYKSDIGQIYELDPKAPHTPTEWAVMELPQSENGESPEGWFMVLKSDCEIVK
jgi:hypothetical protein